MRARVAVLVVFICIAPSGRLSRAQTATESQRTGADLYRFACAACHGTDGTGSSRAIVGFETPLPDFTDCRFASPEADADWIAVVHEGGRARAFDRMMPAFGEALSVDEIQRIVDHLRTFCTERGWPRGDLNLPRPLVTEKAFPENELVVTTQVAGTRDALGNQFLYERRIGRRGQYEIAIPLDAQRTEDGAWHRGVGDLSLGYKHVLTDSIQRGTIVSAGGEIIFPTGKDEHGLGGGATVVEPFVAFGRLLPRNAFLHLHAGFELPLSGTDPPRAAFWRTALGKTLTERHWYRTWSPIVELLGFRDFQPNEPALWDAVPQIQVSLSTRQHVLVNAGVRLPVNQRRDRGKTLMVYLLWDWFDGGFFSGW